MDITQRIEKTISEIAIRRRIDENQVTWHQIAIELAIKLNKLESALNPLYIGVVTPSKNFLEIWIKETGKQMYGDKYQFVRLSKMDDIRGREFFTIEKGIYYYKVDQNVYEAAVNQINFKL